MAILDQLSAKLDRLAAFEAGPFPVVSLYLNTQPDQNGRDHFEPFLRKELAERLRTYAASGPERDSLDKDAEKLRELCRRHRAVGQRCRRFRVRGRRAVRSGRAGGARCRAPDVHLGPAAPLSACPAGRRVSALRGGRSGHQLRPDFRLRREHRRADANRSKARRRGGRRWAAGRRRATNVTSRTSMSSTPRKLPRHLPASSGTTGSRRSSSLATK